MFARIIIGPVPVLGWPGWSSFIIVLIFFFFHDVRRNTSRGKEFLFFAFAKLVAQTNWNFINKTVCFDLFEVRVVSKKYGRCSIVLRLRIINLSASKKAAT